MQYTVKTVSHRRTMKDFLGLPFVIYRDDPRWVAPISSELRRVLDVRRNPYFENATVKLFICYRDGRIGARTAVVISRIHEEKSGIKAAFFGFFESINDVGAVRSLFDEVERYCSDQKVELLEGPFNPNHYSELGIQVTGFCTSPTFFQPYNHTYYRQLLEDVGFNISARFHTRKNDRISEYVRERYGTRRLPQVDGYSIRSFSLEDLDGDLERIREVFNDAFSSNWHYLPVSKEEYQFSGKFLRLVTFPDLIKIVEHGGNPVGVLHCVLDINPLLKRMKGRVGPIRYLRFLRERNRIRKVVIFAVGIKKSYQRSRVYQLLLHAMCQIALKYDALETTWMSEENILAARAAEHLGLKPDKCFVMYEKQVIA